MPEIKIVTTDQEIMACFPVLSELRPHMVQASFVTDVRRLYGEGYQLACLVDDGRVKAVAGFRLSESFAWKKYLYVDDLVSAAGERSRGYGSKMFDWLVDYAKSKHCDQLHLESGVQRFGAHRFYLRKGMNISSHHFQLQLG